jgi:hypothetical protein
MKLRDETSNRRQIEISRRCKKIQIDRKTKEKKQRERKE